jgi:hypothetical protein
VSLRGARFEGLDVLFKDEGIYVSTGIGSVIVGMIMVLFRMELATHHREICTMFSSINGRSMLGEGSGWVAIIVRARRHHEPHSLECR